MNAEPPRDLPAVAERFWRYVQIDTEADRDSTSTPSSEKQKDLSRLLVRELLDLGVANAAMDEHGYVYASLPARGAPESAGADGPRLALVAHVDTSPDAPGGPVKPRLHRSYDGSVIELEDGISLDPAKSPALLDHVGHDLITSDGTTLLGSDDKAGVAVILQTVADLLAGPELPRPALAICFTVDEEIGCGVDQLDLDRLGADVAYTIDGGAVGTFSFETFNAAEAVVRVRGVGVHPGYAKDKMANAATILAEILTALPAERPETTSGREGYFCPHEIEGDVTAARARILLRDFTTEGLADRKETVRRLARAAGARHPRAASRGRDHRPLTATCATTSSSAIRGRSRSPSRRRRRSGSSSGPSSCGAARTGRGSPRWACRRPTCSPAGTTSTAGSNGTPSRIWKLRWPT